ncbi:SRPBCC domain-containing protein [Nocardioides sp.]|uniref:SRPBCC domain-containing protein n=1 Tax=Nocardioides sp. TaxID=35761 RepID=UPI0035284720
MAITAHVYQIFIAADADRVWTAITDSEWTEQYFHSTRFVEPPTAGQGYRTVVMPEGRDSVDGVVEEMTPPGDGTPGRFVLTRRVLYDAALAAEPPSRVEWTVEQVGEGLTRVRLVHGDLAGSPLTWAHVKDGWVWVLDGLKTLLETGRTLPAVDLSATDTPPEADWHRRQGVEANNAAFGLLDEPRSPARDESLLRTAYAAAYHWARTPSAGPVNEARATHLVAKALLATGQPERALVSAEACLALCATHGLGDFDLAYAHEAHARALRALGRSDAAAAAWDAATSVTIADPEDRAIVEQDFADW